MKLKSNFSWIFVGFILMKCGVYSLSGASISPDIETISISTFFNNAVLGPSNMSTVFTEKIKDYYQKNTNLALVDAEGDLQLDGYIDNYTITPVAANSSSSSLGDVSQQSRISITVFATYINSQNDTFDFEKNFSFFIDFGQDEDLTSVEEGYMEEIFDQIVIDIFNSSVANW